MKPETEYKIDGGNSTVGPIGFVCYMTGTSPAEALAQFCAAVGYDENKIRLDPECGAGEVLVYFNPDTLTIRENVTRADDEDDQDEGDDAPAAPTPSAAATVARVDAFLAGFEGDDAQTGIADMRAALARLLACPDLNLDSLEPETIAAHTAAEMALKATPVTTARESATMLAALRFWQTRNLPPSEHDDTRRNGLEAIAREHGPELDTEEIDQLCARLTQPKN